MTILNPLYSPYGAYELKAKYQFNFMMGMVTITSVVILILLTFWIVKLLNPKGVVIDITPGYVIEQVIDLPPPPSIDREIAQPEIEVTTSEIIWGGIPEPVPDGQIDDEALIPTIDEKRLRVEPSEIDFDTLENVIVDIPEDNYLPKHTEFVPRQIEPKMIYKHPPIYPRLLEKVGITGIVTVQVLIGKNGNVLDARIGKSSGVEALDEAALKAAYRNKFSPAIQNDRPVAVWAFYQVKFEAD